jgi:peptide/nickel transport system substrate-binding protein
MIPLARRRMVALALMAALALVLAACGKSSSSSSSSNNAARTLVIDKSFDLKTADPGREFEVSGQIVVKAMYDTLLTFEGSDSTKPVPLLAESYTQSPDGKTFTFKLRSGVKFSDNTPMTAADVAFSLNRVRELKGNPSFLMDGVTATAPDDSTVLLKSDKPNPALPFLLPNPGLGVLNSKVVKEHGGTDQPGADKTDKAEAFLNQTSAGSGPYVLESFNTTSQTVVKVNPNYWGAKKPAYSRVVMRNVQANTQRINVEKGDSQLALDLSPDQTSGMSTANLQLQNTASPNIFFLLANANSKVSAVTSTPAFREAVRFGLDYQSLVQLTGQGGRQAAGVIPSMFVGALDQSDAVTRDVAKAKAALGGKTVNVELEYPSDFSANGLSFGPIAERVQANLKEVGINVKLSPKPIATSLENYRAGKEQLGLWLWGPDYPDPSDYLVFGPGRLVGLRAGWAAGADPKIENLAKQAETELDQAKRGPLYQDFQRQLNQSGPFFPIFQPAQVLVAAKSLTNLQYNPTWTVDLASLGAQ